MAQCWSRAEKESEKQKKCSGSEEVVALQKKLSQKNCGFYSNILFVLIFTFRVVFSLSLCFIVQLKKTLDEHHSRASRQRCSNVPRLNRYRKKSSTERLYNSSISCVLNDRSEMEDPFQVCCWGLRSAICLYFHSTYSSATQHPFTSMPTC